MRPGVVYFPNSRVASDGELVSPLSYPGDGPAPHPNDASPGLVPAGGSSPWIVNVPSDEQGIGRSPGHQWPWMIHTEAYNFDQLAVMPFEHEQTNGMPAGEGYGETGREHTGLVGFMPGDTNYYEQAQDAGREFGVVALEDAQSVAYTIGQGFLPTSPEGYGYE